MPSSLSARESSEKLREKPPYLEEIRQEMYEAAIKYGGTVTTEHGTGKTRKKHMNLQYSERNRNNERHKEGL